VTTADVVSAGTLYAVPYVGNRIALYDGATWRVRTSAQFSLALTLTSGKPYDIFCYDNAGVPTLEVLVWTNDTTRATALTTQDGVLVKTGAPTRRYLGTLYASGANTTEDSVTSRYLWNYDHRVARAMAVTDTTNNWSYTTATWRQANGSGSNQCTYVVGLAEDSVDCTVQSFASNTNTGVQCAVGIGIDVTNANSAQLYGGWTGAAANAIAPISASYRGVPSGVGRHTLAWLEISAAAGTTTWRGDEGTTLAIGGLVATVQA
jgi:hypothetical protein